MWSLLSSYWDIYLPKNHMNLTQQELVLTANFCSLVQGLIMQTSQLSQFDRETHDFSLYLTTTS